MCFANTDWKTVILLCRQLCVVSLGMTGFVFLLLLFFRRCIMVECILLFCMVSNLTLFYFSGRSVHESNWSENQNARWTKTMAGGWLGPYHTTKDGNPSQLFRNNSAGVIISVYSKHLILDFGLECESYGLCIFSCLIFNHFTAPCM